MTLQLTGMIKEAVAQKKLTRYSPEKTTSLLLEATTGFHNPRLIAEHAYEKRDNLLKQLLDAVMKGLN